MTRLSVLLLVLVLGACSGPPPAEKAPRTVIVQTLDVVTSASTVRTYAGEVVARHETSLAFRIGGQVVERAVDVGARVASGEVLARLDPQDVRLAANAAGAQREAALADVELARAELQRHERLHGASFISASALDARRTALSAAEARLRQASAQAEVAANQADYAVLRAAHDGVVTAAPVDAGQVVGAGQLVLRLARPEAREVLIHIPEGRVREHAVGQSALVMGLTEDSRYAAVVREIAPSADSATRSYALRVSVPGADKALGLGASARVVFDSETAAQAVLPLAAVTELEGRPTVWLVDQASRLAAIPVKIGAMREDGVVIRSGLPEGASVVVAGVHKLVAGEFVRVVERNAPIALDVSK